MSAAQPIKIEGLRELQAALKAMDGESQKQLRVVLNSTTETIAQAAARRVPRRSGRAAASLRAQSSQREARVAGGSKKVPYYGWLDFGGRIGREHATKRPYVTGGRYIYPALAANRDGMLQALSQALVTAGQAAGLEVRAHGG